MPTKLHVFTPFNATPRELGFKNSPPVLHFKQSVPALAPRPFQAFAEDRAFHTLYPLQSKPIQASARRGSVLYSEAMALIQNKQVGAVRIAQARSALHPYSEATLLLKDGKQVKTLVTRPQNFLVPVLAQHQIPYGFEPYQPKVLERTQDLVSTLWSDTLAPILAFGAMAGATFLGIRQVKGYLAKMETMEVLSQALRKIHHLPGVDTVLPSYGGAVQKAVQRFMSGKLPMLVLEGPPGTGKSYLMDVVAHQMAQTESSVVLNAAVSPDARQVLYQLYLGNRGESARALQSLEKLHGKKFDQILLLGNELHQYEQDIDKLIASALGNPPGMKQISSESGGWGIFSKLRQMLSRLNPWRKPEIEPLRLPELKILATANAHLNFSPPAMSRIGVEGFAFVDHMPPEALVPVLAQRLLAVNPLLKNLFHSVEGHSGQREANNMLQDLQTSVHQILQKFPDYSTRRVMDIIQEVSGQLSQKIEKSSFTLEKGLPGQKAELKGWLNVKQILESLLIQEFEKTPLDGTEVAGLIRRQSLEFLKKALETPSTEKISGIRPEEPYFHLLNQLTPGGEALLNRQSWPLIEEYAGKLGVLLRKNSQRYHQAFPDMVEKLKASGEVNFTQLKPTEESFKELARGIANEFANWAPVL
ncbi:MAG: AAA family ATPase [Cyanobacteria bacterium]|nr:AAA family ATPase [Cyanobacteriota bacterium]